MLRNSIFLGMITISEIPLKWKVSEISHSGLKWNPYRQEDIYWSNLNLHITVILNCQNIFFLSPRRFHVHPCLSVWFFFCSNAPIEFQNTYYMLCIIIFNFCCCCKSYIDSVYHVSFCYISWLCYLIYQIKFWVWADNHIMIM